MSQHQRKLLKAIHWSSRTIHDYIDRYDHTRPRKKKLRDDHLRENSITDILGAKEEPRLDIPLPEIHIEDVGTPHDVLMEEPLETLPSPEIGKNFIFEEHTNHTRDPSHDVSIQPSQGESDMAWMNYLDEDVPDPDLNFQFHAYTLSKDSHTLRDRFKAARLLGSTEMPHMTHSLPRPGSGDITPAYEIFEMHKKEKASSLAESPSRERRISRKRSRSNKSSVYISLEDEPDANPSTSAYGPNLLPTDAHLTIDRSHSVQAGSVRVSIESRSSLPANPEFVSPPFHSIPLWWKQFGFIFCPSVFVNGRVIATVCLFLTFTTILMSIVINIMNYVRM